MQNKTRQEGILCLYGRSARPSRSGRRRLFEKVGRFIHDILGILVALVFLSLGGSGSISVMLLGAAGLGLIFWRISKVYPIQRKDEKK